MDEYFRNRTNEILLQNARNGVVDYKAGALKKCPNKKHKVCLSIAPKKREAELKALLKETKTLTKRSGSKKSVPAKKAPAKKAVKKVVKKIPAKKVPAKKVVKKSVKKAPAKKAVKKVVKKDKKKKGSGLLGGCADCPYCSGSGVITL